MTRQPDPSPKRQRGVSTLGSWRQWWSLPEVVTAVAALVCFVNVLPNDFCYDDELIVRFNPKITEPGQWLSIWTTDYWWSWQVNDLPYTSGTSPAQASPNRDLLYRPIPLCSYRLIHILGQGSPWLQHLVNVVLHALVSVLIVRLCRRLGGTNGAALLAGVLFAVLPIHTEVVAPVVGRADLLATAGVLITLLAHRRSVCVRTHTGRSMQAATHAAPSAPEPRALARADSRRTCWRIVAAAAAFGAMASKEAGITVVALTVLFDAYWYRRPAGMRDEASALRGPPKADWDPRHARDSTAAAGGGRYGGWQTPLRLTYLLIPLATYLALRYHALGGQLYQRPPLTKTVNVLVDAPFWQHLLGVLQLWGMYWAKTVWPAVLSLKYSINSIRLATSPMEAHVLIGAGVAIGLVVASVVAWRCSDRPPWRTMRSDLRIVAFLSAAIGLSYLPTANALVLIRVFFAERVWYLPSVWIAILTGLAVAAMGGMAKRSAPEPRALARADFPRILWVLFAVPALAMTLRCWARNAEWNNNGTLYAAAVRDQPDAVGPLHLYGQWLVEHDDLQRGLTLLNRAIEIDLGLTDAHRALGTAHLRAGNLEPALRHLQIADMQVPNHPPTVADLARVSHDLSQRDEELVNLRRYLVDRADDVAAEIALLQRLRELGLTGEALARLEQSESDFANIAAWQAEYAVTLVYLNRRDQAVERYRQSLRLDPDNPQRAVELAMLLRERRAAGDLDEAWRWAEHASTLAPDAPSVLICRAELRALRGDLKSAIALYERAIRALPVGSDRRRLFEQRAKALGR